MKKSDEYSNTFDKKMEQPRPGVNYSFQNSSFQKFKMTKSLSFEK